MNNDDLAELETSLEILLPEHLQPPMSNGEVIFEAPWQGRVFAIAVALSEQGVFAWSDFQQSLIQAIALRDVSNAVETNVYEYFTHFQKALEDLLATKSIVLPNLLDEREKSFAARPHAHDH
jgi:nitrile hydratase accessory protein